MKSYFYEKDFYAWTQEQAELLRSGKLAELDVGNLAEEIEALGRAEKRSLRSSLERITAFLLLLKLSIAAHPRNGWQAEAIYLRFVVARDLTETPSLNSLLPQLFEQSWVGAVARLNRTIRELGGFIQAPVSCPFSLQQVLDAPIDDDDCAL